MTKPIAYLHTDSANTKHLDFTPLTDADKTAGWTEIALIEQPTAVKPLEWVEDRDGDMRADALGGKYLVWWLGKGWVVMFRNKDLAKFPTLHLGQEFADSHNYRRLSEWIDTPVATGINVPGLGPGMDDGS